MSGWVKLHRDLQSHWIYSFKEPDKALAWIDLILLASHSGGSFMAKGKLVEYQRGQVAMSQLTLQKRWGMSQNKLKRFLELLKKQSMIDFKTNELTTVITICNYSSFQSDEQTDERPLERTVERATNEQSNDIIRMKERKECKEENISKPKRSAVPFSEIVNLYHTKLPMLAQVYKMTQIRKNKVKLLWNEELQSLTAWENYFDFISQSAFLTGKTIGKDGRAFIADFDFIVNQTNFVKIAEEKYHGKKV